MCRCDFIFITRSLPSVRLGGSTIRRKCTGSSRIFVFPCFIDGFAAQSHHRNVIRKLTQIEVPLWLCAFEQVQRRSCGNRHWRLRTSLPGNKHLVLWKQSRMYVRRPVIQRAPLHWRQLASSSSVQRSTPVSVLRKPGRCTPTRKTRFTCRVPQHATIIAYIVVLLCSDYFTPDPFSTNRSTPPRL